MELGAEVNVEADVEMTDGIGEVGGGTCPIDGSKTISLISV